MDFLFKSNFKIYVFEMQMENFEIYGQKVLRNGFAVLKKNKKNKNLDLKF